MNKISLAELSITQLISIKTHLCETVRFEDERRTTPMSRFDEDFKLRQEVLGEIEFLNGFIMSRYKDAKDLYFDIEM